MQALIQPTYGTVEIREIETPVPRPNEVLVRTHAAGLNAADRLMLRGVPYAIRLGAGGLRRPRPNFIPGRALAGRITAIGSGVHDLRVGDKVHDLRVGDEVLAEAPGAFAEFVRVRADLIALKPPTVSFTDAAALPLSGTTALQMIRQIKSGHRILITGAAGSIGTLAVQLARTLTNAHVTAECATRNMRVMREISDEVISYETSTPLPTGFDAVLDLAGNHTIAELRNALNPTGRLLLSVGTGGRWLGPARRILTATLTGRRPKPVLARPDRDDLSTLATMVESGQIRPIIDTVHPWTAAPTAMDHLNTGRITGKLILQMNDRI